MNKAEMLKADILELKASILYYEDEIANAKMWKQKYWHDLKVKEKELKLIERHNNDIKTWYEDYPPSEVK